MGLGGVLGVLLFSCDVPMLCCVCDLACAIFNIKIGFDNWYCGMV